MKRFHVHVAVDNLADGVRFYSTVFGMPPTVQKPDYAKWMVDDPCLNFAISARGGKPGVNHLGFQLDSGEEFRAMHAQLAAADAGLVEETNAHCCYAQSDKYWVTDPAGVAWETYHTLGSIPMFGGAAGGACCTGEAPAARADEARKEEVASACCAPAGTSAQACCAPASASACCP